MSLRDAAPSLAVAALGGIFAVPGAVISGGVGLLASLIPGAAQEDRAKDLMAFIAEALPDDEVAEPDEVETARALLRRERLTEVLAHSASDPMAAADLVLGRGATLLRSFEPQSRERVRRMLEGFFTGLQHDPEILKEVQVKMTAHSMEGVRALRATLDASSQQAEFLRRVETQWDVDQVLYDPSADLLAVRPHGDVGPSQLLNARYEVVPFWGREQELGALLAFREREDRLASVVIEGEGGLGKTRLAMEAVRLAERDGWTAGFVRLEATGETLQRGLRALDELGKPVLVVADYGEDRPEQVATLVRAWLDAYRSGQKRRLVLLVRRRNLLGPSLDRIVAGAPDLRAAVDYLTGSAMQPLPTPSLQVPVEAREAVFTEAQRQFAGWQGVSVESLPGPPETLTSTDPAYVHLGLPLYLHMAAFASLEGPPKVRKPDLLEYVLKRNWEFVERHLNDVPALRALGVQREDVEAALTVATLARAARPPWECQESCVRGRL